MGLECIGDVGTYETAEVLMLASKSLASLSKRYVIDISHMGFVDGILEASGADFVTRSEIMTYIKEKNSHDITKACDRAGISLENTERICKAAALWGGFEEMLPQLKEISVNEKTENAIKDLEEIYSILKINGCSEYVKIDFSVMNEGFPLQ